MSDSTEESLNELITRFWIQEELPHDNTDSLSSEERECEEHFQSTHLRDSSGRYIVRLPLKSSPSLLGNSFFTAYQCLQRQLKRLNKDHEYSTLYHQFMTEYEELGHMTRAPESSLDGSSIYYLPHHGVLRPDSTTTKLRVVFNGSCKSSSDYSVNDIMHTGPNLLLNINEVFIWLRRHKLLFSTDITKMYRQIQVHEQDQDLQRILWIDKYNNIVPYKLTTVTYGTRAAPYLAVRALLQLSHDEGENYPLATAAIKYGRYVDDIFGGSDDIETLITAAHQLKEMCAKGGFPLAKWHANNGTALSAISPSADPSTSVSLDDCETKILGLIWSPQTDTLTFVNKNFKQTELFTKRNILSEIAQVFDPLGLASPVIIKAKMLMQELWLQKLSWDETLPHHIIARWKNIREDLQSLARLSIPRWFNTLSTSTVELHGFSDASQLAMAAVVYILVKSPSTEPVTSLITSKTKVSPLNKLTIPRLELSAALLLTQLTKSVSDTLKLEITNIYLWTDSQVTLTWIRAHPSRWKDFVRNRVAKIQTLLPNAIWKYTPGTINPADCASRGITTEQLIHHPIWWTGPPWLTKADSSWPHQPEISDNASSLEARPGVSLVVASPTIDYHWDLIYKYSSLCKLIKITALCFRIFNRLKNRTDSSPVIIIPVADLHQAKIFWIKATQAVYFSAEIKALQSKSWLPNHHPFSRLTAYIDEEGVIRVGGRLQHSSLSHEGKHPAILPCKSRLSELIIDWAHQRTLHGGTQLTLSQVRQEYWILGGRTPVRQHVWRCVVCARQRGIRAHQLMGQLPLSRVTPSSPFQHTGIDYAGPVIIKCWKGRGSKTQKGWICVFICFATTAIHLELVTDYSSDGFIAAYRRFISRRCIPSSLYSDCGTNLKGAESELKQLFSQSSREYQHIASVLAKDHCQWSFNPPAAPHMGGLWEAAVKSTKFHLKRTIGDTIMTYEEFTTLLVQIEAVLNSRPLEPLSNDPEDVSALTPGHFITGKPLTTLPEPSLLNLNTSRLSRWQLIQQKLQQFWTLWSKHHLNHHQAISKWKHPNLNVQVGALVLITDERSPPSKWPLARIISLDNKHGKLPRVATLKTATTELIRPLTKLVILLPSPSSSTATSPSRDHQQNHPQTHEDDGGECSDH